MATRGLWIRVAVVLAVGLGGGVWPTWRLAGRQGLVAMGFGAGSALLGLLAGLIILARKAKETGPKVAMTFLLTAPVRMAVSVGTAMTVWWVGDQPAAPLLIWTALVYLLLLAAEANWLTGILKGQVARTE